MIKQWLKARKLKRCQERARRGYDYAAGVILRAPGVYKKETLHELRCQADVPRHFADDSEATYFDAGIEQACNAYEQLLNKL